MVGRYPIRVGLGVTPWFLFYPQVLSGFSSPMGRLVGGSGGDGCRAWLRLALEPGPSGFPDRQNRILATKAKPQT